MRAFFGVSVKLYIFICFCLQYDMQVVHEAISSSSREASCKHNIEFEVKLR